MQTETRHHSAPLAVDLDAFRATMREAGADDAVDMILGTFVSDATERRSSLASALNAGNAEQIQAVAHAFKSAASSIGATELASTLLRIELAAQAGGVENARALAATAERDAQAAVTQVHEYLDSVAINA